MIHVNSSRKNMNLDCLECSVQINLFGTDYSQNSDYSLVFVWKTIQIKKMLNKSEGFSIGISKLLWIM